MNWHCSQLLGCWERATIIKPSMFFSLWFPVHAPIHFAERSNYSSHFWRKED
jgi:hypothetical protein